MILLTLTPEVKMLIFCCVGCISLLLWLIHFLFAPWKLFDYDSKDSRYCKKCAAHQIQVQSHYMYNANVFVPDNQKYWVESEKGTKPNCRCRRHAYKTVTDA